MARTLRAMPHALISPIISLCQQFAPPMAEAPTSLPQWLLLAPAGDFTGRDGRSYTNGDPDALAAAFDDTSALPIDWEHSTHLRAPQGESAPAAGWITGLEVRDGEVWGAVEWNERGAADLRARAYRYYSPAYLLGEGGTIRQLVSVGLTNQPNLKLPALNQRAPTNPEPAMDELIRKALGLAEGATPEQAVAKIDELRIAMNRAQSQAEMPDLSRFVPRADLDAALNRATQAETTLRETQQAELSRQVDALIKEGLNSRRITPATESYHRAQAATDGGLERLREYLSAAPVVIGESGPRGTPPEGSPSLNASQAAIAAAFGHSAETLAKYGDPA